MATRLHVLDDVKDFGKQRRKRISTAIGVSGSKICAWCEKVLVFGNASSPVSHGICRACVAEQELLPSEALESLSGRELDQLPFGVISLSNEGVVLAYNKAESAISLKTPADVIGRHFFDEVAPCAKVSAFYVEFLRLTSQSVNGRKELSFVFRFKTGAIAVKMVLLYDAQKKCTLVLVNPVSREGLPGDYAYQSNSGIVETTRPVQALDFVRKADRVTATGQKQVGMSSPDPRRIAPVQQPPSPGQPELLPQGASIRVLINYILSIIH